MVSQVDGYTCQDISNFVKSTVYQLHLNKAVNKGTLSKNGNSLQKLCHISLCCPLRTTGRKITFNLPDDLTHDIMVIIKVKFIRNKFIIF